MRRGRHGGWRSVNFRNSAAGDGIFVDIEITHGHAVLGHFVLKQLRRVDVSHFLHCGNLSGIDSHDERGSVEECPRFG
jgi:hypothetical protein